ncbi:MAG TPA: DUF2520 domain-containing protein [Thermoanaerobaculia bacterium]|jgi:predicted short-subunit dehydrogenase-like oxidoreductase (DUF2520 family)|nr:DUF2520 domain-containing protein [Thermoanaerobaculia bacterium]
MQTPLAGLRFSVAGPGKAGSSLARWAMAAGAELVAVAGRRVGEPAWPGGPERVALADLDTAGQDLLLIAVGDGAVAEVAARLAARPQARVVLHTSGSLDASALAPLRAGSKIGSLHPLKAFPQPLPDPAEGRGVFFAVDGDPEARELACRMAGAWGGVAAEVPAEARPLYHFAATLAAGGVVTLLAAAAEIAGGIGLPEEVTRGYLELARGSLAAAARALDEGKPLAAAITGPVTRDDRETLRKHLAALGSLTPEKLPLAIFLLGEILHQTGRED